MATSVFDHVEVKHHDTDPEEESISMRPSACEDVVSSGQAPPRQGWASPTNDVVKYTPQQASPSVENPNQRAEWTVDVGPVEWSAQPTRRDEAIALPQSVDDTPPKSDDIPSSAATRRELTLDARIAKNTAKPEPVERALSLPVNSFEKQGLAHSRWARANWFAIQETTRRHGWRVSPAPSATTLRSGSGESEVNQSPLFNTVQMAMHDPMLRRGSQGQLVAAPSPTSHARVIASPVPSRSGSSEDNKSETRSAQTVEWLRRGIQLRVYYAVYLIVTFYVLFGEDIYILCDPPVGQDPVVFGISTGAFCMFFLDLLVRSLAEPGYALSSMFWLDGFSVCSLVPSVLHAFGLGTEGNGGAGTTLHLLRGGRAATSGARLARFVRVLHFASRVLAESSMNTTTVSRMSSSIDRHLTRHVIAAVGGMLLIFIGFAYLENTDVRAHEMLQSGVAVLDTAWMQVGEGGAFQDILARFRAGLEGNNQELLFLQLSGGLSVGSPEARRRLRHFPLQYLTLQLHCGPAGSADMCEIHVGDKTDSLIGAQENVVFVASLLALLTLIAVTMSASARKELLEPIEKVVETLDQIMLQPWKRLEVQAEDEDESKMMSIKLALRRIGNLLQLGFGEAGMRTVSRSLCEGEIDFNRKGNLIYGVFGFCDIRNFTDCTEVLGAEIVHLVNNIATHVHQAVIDNGGAPNKNIGDAFLLVWKPKGSTNLLQVADSALRSNLTTMLEMQRCARLRRWEARPDIQARMPGFRVRMGFGLHYGWAIEGAIGSHHKIDASYLSSSVNLASRLENATKQYGTPILLSGDIYNLLSDKVRKLCRLVDRVTVKGSEHPILLFTYDMPLLHKPLEGQDHSCENYRDYSNEDFFELFRPRLAEEFGQQWRVAVGSYLGGPGGREADWAKAEAGLMECLRLEPADGPAAALGAVIQRLGGRGEDGQRRAPEDWQGFRALTDK